MSLLKNLQKTLADHEQDPLSTGMELRVGFAKLVLDEMDRKKWNQRTLAKAAGMKPSFISRVIHSDSNCTFEVAGRILHALGITSEFSRRDPAVVCERKIEVLEESETTTEFEAWDEKDGEENCEISGTDYFRVSFQTGEVSELGNIYTISSVGGGFAGSIRKYRARHEVG